MADSNPNSPQIPGKIEALMTTKTLDSGRLFGELREILICHEGEKYRLRITRRNKLILQK